MGSDSLMECMDFCWSSLSEGGVLCVDRLSHGASEEVFADFCRSKGAKSLAFRTRYGSGIAAR
jgi:hypothetical protein